MKLDIGSGHIRRTGYKRLDVDPDTDADYQVRIEEIEDTIEPASVDSIFSAHTLEHLGFNRACFGVLRSFWRILRPGGDLELIVPNAEKAVIDYTNDRIDWGQFKKVAMGSDPDATGEMEHKNLFSPSEIERYLEITGFVNIVRLHGKDYEIHYKAERPAEEDPYDKLENPFPGGIE